VAGGDYGDVAVVTARQSGKGANQGRPIPEAVWATVVLVRDGGGWRLASNHVNSIAGTAGAPPLPGEHRPAPRNVEEFRCLSS
jgi:hypothetical protein